MLSLRVIVQPSQSSSGMVLRKECTLSSFGKDMSIELHSENEDTKTLLGYAEAFIEKHRRDNNG